MSARKKAAADRLERLAEGFDEMAKRARDAVKELAQFDADAIDAREKAVEREHKSEVAELQDEISSLNDRLNEAENRIEELEEKAEDFDKLVEVLGEFNHLQVHLILRAADPVAVFLRERELLRSDEKDRITYRVESSLRLMPDDDQEAYG